MCCKSFWKKTISFVLALGIGLFVATTYQTLLKGNVESSVNMPIPMNFKSVEKSSNSKDYNTTKVKILEKPIIAYCALTKEAKVSGKVSVNITFMENGKVGDVLPFSYLSSSELNEKAIRAAKLIKFEPATRNGVPYTVIERVEYNF